MVLKSTEIKVLRVLVNADKPLWPMDIAQALKTPYGTVYGALRSLYDMGWAIGVTEKKRPGAGRPPRVFYRLTATGRAEAADLVDERSGGTES